MRSSRKSFLSLLFLFLHLRREKDPAQEYKTHAMVWDRFPSALQTSFIFSAVPSPRHKLPPSRGQAPFVHPLPSAHSSQREAGDGRAACKPHIPLFPKDGEAPLSAQEKSGFIYSDSPPVMQQQGAGPPILDTSGSPQASHSTSTWL